MTYDQWLLALCLWREARGCSIEALTGIAAVIRNRALDKQGRWPRDTAGVILQPAQFSSFNTGDPNSLKFPRPALKSPDEAAWQMCTQVALATLTPDPTDGATNYESEPLDKLPKWANPLRLTVTIPPFRFYKL